VSWWWHEAREPLIELLGSRQAAYVYHRATLERAAGELKSLRAVDRVHFAVKANPNPEVLRVLHAAGIAMECVSQRELEHVFRTLPGLDASTVLFTPNFAPREEYVAALARGVNLTIDNLYALQAWPELFRGRSVLVRIDTGTGRGHHQHVRTAGVYSKFGVPLDELPELQRLAKELRLEVRGLHSHSGSGIVDIANWTQAAELLGELARQLGGVGTLNLGGGFGVPDTADPTRVDLAKLDAALLAFKETHPGLSLWIEPGRYLVAVAGVLLARVTQLKQKGSQGYVGVAAGMNALIRPALYGAFHEIVNLSRLGQDSLGIYDVVGPICESGDVLGHDRLLPETLEGDVLLIANAGAYGRAMASSYNLREPPEELLL
jgi:diaminopimelate decarboxylase/aspartate kinase